MIRGDIDVAREKAPTTARCGECGFQLSDAPATALSLTDTRAFPPLIIARACCQSHAERIINRRVNASLAV